jgi:hypothetical protein
LFSNRVKNGFIFLLPSISCLVALKRMNEALAFVNKIIEENEENQRNVHLYVLRARLHLKYNNVSIIYGIFFIIINRKN